MDNQQLKAEVQALLDDWGANPDKYEFKKHVVKKELEEVANKRYFLSRYVSEILTRVNRINDLFRETTYSRHCECSEDVYFEFGVSSIPELWEDTPEGIENSKRLLAGLLERIRPSLESTLSSNTVDEADEGAVNEIYDILTKDPGQPRLVFAGGVTFGRGLPKDYRVYSIKEVEQMFNERGKRNPADYRPEHIRMSEEFESLSYTMNDNILLAFNENLRSIRSNLEIYVEKGQFIKEEQDFAAADRFLQKLKGYLNFSGINDCLKKRIQVAETVVLLREYVDTSRQMINDN